MSAATGRPSTDGWIDASAPLDGPLPVWPTSAGVQVVRSRDIGRGDPVTETTLTADVHCGTHVDAPAHVRGDGGTVSSLPIDAFVGPAVVVDATGRASVDAADVAALVPAGATRVLFRTDNSARRSMRDPVFDPSFVALTADGAAALAARAEVVLVGNDYLSIQLYGGDDATHHALLDRGIAVIEGLDLTDVDPGAYDLIAVPLRLDEAEASPVRALLRRTKPKEESS